MPTATFDCDLEQGLLADSHSSIVSTDQGKNEPIDSTQNDHQQGPDNNFVEEYDEKHQDKPRHGAPSHDHESEPQGLASNPDQNLHPSKTNEQLQKLIEAKLKKLQEKKVKQKQKKKQKRHCHHPHRHKCRHHYNATDKNHSEPNEKPSKQNFGKSSTTAMPKIPSPLFKLPYRPFKPSPLAQSSTIQEAPVPSRSETITSTLGLTVQRIKHKNDNFESKAATTSTSSLENHISTAATTSEKTTTSEEKKPEEEEGEEAGEEEEEKNAQLPVAIEPPMYDREYLNTIEDLVVMGVLGFLYLAGFLAMAVLVWWEWKW